MTVVITEQLNDLAKLKATSDRAIFEQLATSIETTNLIAGELSQWRDYLDRTTSDELEKARERMHKEVDAAIDAAKAAGVQMMADFEHTMQRRLIDLVRGVQKTQDNFVNDARAGASNPTFTGRNRY